MFRTILVRYTALIPVLCPHIKYKFNPLSFSTDLFRAITTIYRAFLPVTEHYIKSKRPKLVFSASSGKFLQLFYFSYNRRILFALAHSSSTTPLPWSSNTLTSSVTLIIQLQTAVFVEEIVIIFFPQGQQVTVST